MTGQLEQHQVTADPTWEIPILRNRIAELENLVATLETRVNQRLGYQGDLLPVDALETDATAMLNGGLSINGPFDLGDEPYQVTLSGTTHDLRHPDGRTIDASIIRVSASGAWTLTGIVPVAEDTRYQVIRLLNASGFAGTLAHNHSGSSANYRLSMAGDADFELRSGRYIDLQYDPSSHVWRSQPLRHAVIRSVQRGTITITAGNSTATVTLATTLTSTGKAVVDSLGFTKNTTATEPYLHDLSTTQLSATRTGTTDTSIIAYQVTEFFD